MTADEVPMNHPAMKNYRPKDKPVDPRDIPPLEKKPSPLTEICRWYRNGKIVPYADVKDLNHMNNSEFGPMEDIASRPAVEVGIKFRF